MLLERETRRFVFPVKERKGESFLRVPSSFNSNSLFPAEQMNERRQSARASSLVTQRNCPSRMDRDAHTQRESELLARKRE